MKKTTFALSALFSLPMALSHADVKLPAIISDHMVLEKTAKVPVWGKADPGEEVTITLEGQSVKATAGADGKWKAVLDLSKSGQGPFEMTVQGKNTIKISDVVVGEVWVASGQSNMEWILTNTDDAQAEIANSTNPLLRQFAVKKATSAVPLDDCEGRWVSASPETAGSFTAVGYYFGKALQNELKVPVGLVHTSWGGTPSEAWTSSSSLDLDPGLKAGKEKIYTLLKTQPDDQKKWAVAFGEWLKANNREDKPSADVAKYAAPDAPLEGWEKVTLPGNIAAGKVTGNGVVWLRTEVERAEPSKENIGFELGAIEGFESIYWNGELLTALNYRDYPGTGHVRRWGKYTVPPDKIKTGKNTLAIRVYAPAGPAKFPVLPKAAGKPMATEWLATEEVSLPALTAEQTASAPKAPPVAPGPQNVASYLYNGMINPIVPYAISGAIWYQGESNAGRSYQYRSAFPLMIADWRKAWDQGDFPFYFCQLANFMDKKPAPGDSGWAELREAQCMALELPSTGQAILIDIGESGDIHPRNKKDVGNRLSLIALAKDYGKSIPYSGPTYNEVKFESGKARVSFKQTDGGLVAKPVPATYSVVSKENKTAPTVRNSPNSELEGFAICGEDKKWVWAEAKIDGNDVVVWSDKVSNPVAVRYAWSENPTVNLYNGAGLPACPFRTDFFPAATANAKYGF